MGKQKSHRETNKTGNEWVNKLRNKKMTILARKRISKQEKFSQISPGTTRYLFEV